MLLEAHTAANVGRSLSKYLNVGLSSHMRVARGSEENICAKVRAEESEKTRLRINYQVILCRKCSLKNPMQE